MSDLVCKICNKTFQKQNKLLRHIREIHENIRNYECQICHLFFKRKQHLDQHLVKHSDNPTPFKCPFGLCGLQFALKYHLDRHIKNKHEENTQYQCIQCQISFPKKINFIKHNCDMHEEQRPYQCNIEGCKKKEGFYKQADFIKHIQKMHTNYKYDLYLKKAVLFNPSNEVKQECANVDFQEIKKEIKKEIENKEETKLILKKEKQYLYLCPYENCGKAFSKGYNLKVHIQCSHQKQKNFICSQCSKQFCHKKSLMQHINKNHQKIQDVSFEKQQQEIIGQ